MGVWENLKLKYTLFGSLNSNFLVPQPGFEPENIESWARDSTTHTTVSKTDRPKILGYEQNVSWILIPTAFACQSYFQVESVVELSTLSLRVLVSTPGLPPEKKLISTNKPWGY